MMEKMMERGNAQIDMLVLMLEGPKMLSLACMKN